MSISAQDALVHLMVVTASSDSAISEGEFGMIRSLVQRAPVFQGYDEAAFTRAANACVDLINGNTGLEGALDGAVAAIPERVQDTAYALCVEVAVVDLALPQEELRLLEMIRDRLKIDRLATSAIESAARARMRRL